MYRIPDYPPFNTARNNFLTMAGVSENQNGSTTSSDCGDRGLVVY